jgi:hypothetical protein
MKNLMKTLVAAFVVVMVLAASASALDAEQRGVVGTWTFSAEGYVLEMVLAHGVLQPDSIEETADDDEEVSVQPPMTRNRQSRETVTESPR